LPLWDRKDPRRADLIARRCSSADAVAQWVREQRDGNLDKVAVDNMDEETMDFTDKQTPNPKASPLRPPSPRRPAFRSLLPTQPWF